jgi:dihydrofolate synthase / folylpolyglutamate synthase
MIIRKYTSKDATAVCEVVCNTFNRFVSIEFTQDGRKKFLGEQTPEKQNERAKTRSVYVALENNKVVGMVEATYPDHLNRIFVNENCQGKGIGKKLMKKIETTFKEKGSTKIKVYSSPYAIKFYQGIGYKKTTGIIHRFGFVYQPMMKKFR